MMFTPEELAAMRAADEEIDRTFEMTEDDLQLSRAIDQQARQERSKRAAPKPRTEEQRARPCLPEEAVLGEARGSAGIPPPVLRRAPGRPRGRNGRIPQAEAGRGKSERPDLFHLWLKQNGITQKEAAERLCVSLNCVTCWAAGIFRPKVDKIRAVWPEYGGET